MRKKSTIFVLVLVLLVQSGVFFSCAPHTTSASSKPAEKLILGFERAELNAGKAVTNEDKPSRDWFYLIDGAEGFDFSTAFEWPGGRNRAWKWLCRPGEHTEGEFALVTTARPANPKGLTASFKQTEFLSHFYPSARDRFEAELLMTTFQWLVKSRPELRDWSGYDVLRIDVRSEDAPVETWLALEDNILEPPVVRTFKVPTGKWVTLELNLSKAVKVRKLDLANITNFWLIGRASVRSTMRIDNIRIAKRGAAAEYKLLRDYSSMAVSYVQPKRPVEPRRRPGVKPDRSAIKLTKPMVVAEGAVAPLGWVSAYDNNLIFVAYSTEKGTKPKAAYTDDGGETWKQLPEPQARNLDHGTARGCAIDVAGDGVAISSGPGCAGIGRAAPRQHLTKYTFTGKGWEAEPTVILDSDIRHCGSNASAVRLRSGPYKGRLWASWGEIGREHIMGVHVKFSDDDGQTWIPWNKGALLPGSKFGEWSNGTYGYPETVVTPYKKHVACFWRHKSRCGVMWSFFNGTKWSKPKEISPVVLDNMDGAYRATMSAVTRGDSEIFFTATGLSTVLRWDGKNWHKEPVEIEDGGMLSLAGDVVTVFNSGKVNRRWKDRRWQRPAVIRYYRRRPDGQWEKPVELTDKFNIVEYRSLTGFSVPPYSPPNFIPLVWSDFDEDTIKLLKVPVTERSVLSASK
ncbi:MAG: hypothetical protein ACYS1A_04510 [Planctomycetota bacterium]|jgi:hypothetical protein